MKHLLFLKIWHGTNPGTRPATPGACGANTPGSDFHAMKEPTGNSQPGFPKAQFFLTNLIISYKTLKGFTDYRRALRLWLIPKCLERLKCWRLLFEGTYPGWKKQTDGHLVKFSQGKCKVLPPGRSNSLQRHRLGTGCLESRD